MKHALEAIKTPSFHSAIHESLARFLAFKRSTGRRYEREANRLAELDRFLAIRLPRPTERFGLEVVNDYVARRGKESERTRYHRLVMIRQVFAFLAAEGHTIVVPPPRYLGLCRTTFIPRVLTPAEAGRFVRACLSYESSIQSPVRGPVHGTGMALLYLAGLRAGELLSLTLSDVDCKAGVLTVRDSKFGKSRWVPLRHDVAALLGQCRQKVDLVLGTRQPDQPFFCGPTGARVSDDVLRGSFVRVLSQAQIPEISAGRGLRLHDLRHSFAVHRLLSWYRKGISVESKLPVLATYMGHVGLSSTQAYLHLTREMVGEVAKRHERRFGHLITERNERP